jgi:hypothetical protein
MTAIGTPRCASSYRTNGERHADGFFAHPLPLSACARSASACPASTVPRFTHRDLPAVEVCRAESQPFSGVACRCASEHAVNPSLSRSVRRDDRVFGSFSPTFPTPA